MDKVYRKNLFFICIFMILIHFAGLIYQIITKSTFLAISLKLIFIVIFILFLISLILKLKFAHIIGIISSAIIIAISAIYMDFLSILIALLVFYYSLNLIKCKKKSNLEIKSKNKKYTNKIK